MQVKIPFNRPWLTGRELEYIKEAAEAGHLSGNGPFTAKCRELVKKTIGISDCLFTTSCTDALEMAAILTRVEKGDEVIVPAYTFVSTPLAFARQGATVIFADSREDDPCIDEKKLESLITEKTKVIVPVHYAGRVCNMDAITEIASRYGLAVVEDAAHSWGSSYKGRSAGSAGALGCFSFHETKVVHCGEGGMIALNDKSFIERAEQVHDKGTNRAAFFRGEIPFYEWTETGSSFLLSDINSAFLAAQLEKSEEILARRKETWIHYYESLKDLHNQGFLTLPAEPEEGYNFYSFHILTSGEEERDALRKHLLSKGIQAVPHYRNLAVSEYARSVNGYKPIPLPNAERFSATLLRMPLWIGLREEDVSMIAGEVKQYFHGRKGK